MEPTTPTQPETPPTQPPAVPQKPVAESHENRPIVHTFQEDLSLAMNATDAHVVQEMLHTAREREELEKERDVVRHQKGWYTTGGVILVILALGAIVYGGYYYRTLTVSVAPLPTVGVFQNIAPVITDKTASLDAITTITTSPDIIEGKPVLVPVLSDSTTLTPLSSEEVFRYFGIDFGEPFLAAISLVRLGVYNNGTRVSPFLIFSVPNAEIASKEFLIAEPKLLDSVGAILAIPPRTDAEEVSAGFESSYMYNLPVRTLASTNIDTNVKTIILYYGYATERTIVVATDPSVLKAVYDTIIRQR